MSFATLPLELRIQIITEYLDFYHVRYCKTCRVVIVPNLTEGNWCSCSENRYVTDQDVCYGLLLANKQICDEVIALIQCPKQRIKEKEARKVAEEEFEYVISGRAALDEALQLCSEILERLERSTQETDDMMRRLEMNVADRSRNQRLKTSEIFWVADVDAARAKTHPSSATGFKIFLGPEETDARVGTGLVKRSTHCLGHHSVGSVDEPDGSVGSCRKELEAELIRPWFTRVKTLPPTHVARYKTRTTQTSFQTFMSEHQSYRRRP